MGRRGVDSAEDRLRTADTAGVGSAPRDRPRRARWRDTAKDQRVKGLEREFKELRRANEILKLASAFFAQAELDRRLKS